MPTPFAHIVIIVSIANKMVEAGDLASQIHRRVDDGFYTNQTEHDAAVAAMGEAETKLQSASDKLQGAIDILEPFIS